MGSATSTPALAANDLPPGYRFAGIACGIKASGKPDLALIVADQAVVAAGLYTTNQVVAAPVLLCRSRTPTDGVRAVVINSGNANACTGTQGEHDAMQMTQQVAEALGVPVESVLVMSTGVIGQTLPMDKITVGIGRVCTGLDHQQAAFHAAADAILTTDKTRKVAARSLTIGADTYRIAGMCKGAGMIAPNMATMLSVVLTDAPLSVEAAQRVLAFAVRHSFNRVSVDGHTSTNDTIILLARQSDQPLDALAVGQFQDVLTELCIELAKQLPADGEGALHVLQLKVSGAICETDAEQIARVVAASPLVKTAITGGDPNWGRIVSAAGVAGPKIDVSRTCLTILGVPVFLSGQPVAFDNVSLSQAMRAATLVDCELQVGDGPGEAVFWASDLTCDYVEFNSLYTT